MPAVLSREELETVGRFGTEIKSGLIDPAA
jgi:hypothetical protein